MMRWRFIAFAIGCFLAAEWGVSLHAAEMKLFDSKRITVLVEEFNPQKGKLTVYLTNGEKRDIELRQIAAISFSGRSDYFIRTGDQQFAFQGGGHLCAAAENLEKGETLTLRSQSLGRHTVPIAFVHGFTALATEGRAARLAEDLMDEEGVPDTVVNRFLDHILDRRGVPYAGVVERFDPRHFEFEHDQQLQRVRIETHRVAGVRLAEAAKHKPKLPGLDDQRVGIRCRDRSYLVGRLVSIDPFNWRMQPDFDPDRTITIAASEITGVDFMGGRVVFLTQMRPVVVDEQTMIAPPQPFQKNNNAQGESMDIGGFIYHNGIGVHARSSLTYRLEGKFQTFMADVGIDGRLEDNGSVVFAVVGDGKELYRSPPIRGRSAGGGYPIEVSVAGVRDLKLIVDPTADLDHGDLANWGVARVLR